MELTAQELLNTVWRHLRSQGRRSMRVDPDDGCMICAYRGADGLKCAIGCLISDAEYDAAHMEGACASDVVSTFQDELHRLTPHAHLLDELQSVHDKHEPWEREEALTLLAEDRGLKALAPDSDPNGELGTRSGK